MVVLTPSQRLDAFLAGRPVDRPPVTPILMQFAAKFIGRTYAELCQDHRVLVEAWIRCYEAFGFDMVMLISDPYREAADLGASIDFPNGGGPVMREPPLQSFADLARLKPVEPLHSNRMLDRLRAAELFRRELGDDVPVLGWVEGPIAEAADLRGLNQFLLDLYDEPGAAAELMDFCLEVGKGFAREQVRAGAQYIGIGDAAASLISPRLYESAVLPREQELIAYIHKQGARVKLHICGNIANHLPLVCQSGADIIDIDWMAPIEAALASLPPASVLCGNFDPVAVLMQATPEEVREAALDCVRRGGGRLIVSAGCEAPADTPHENMRAFCSPEAFDAFAALSKA